MPTKTSRQTAFTVAVSPASEVGGTLPLQVYVAMARDAAAAIEAVRAVTDPDATVELSGTLSDRLTARLKLRPDEVRPI
ncbi:hypothetical protein [Methylobacterium sp. JK268]